VVLNITFVRFTLVSFPSNCTQNSGGLTCSLGNLALNASQTISLGVSAPNGGWASITGSANANGVDPNPANNSANLAPPENAYNTAAGNAFVVSVGDSAASAVLDFSHVTAPGNTSLTTLPLALAPPLGFRSGAANVYYELASTATYSGAVGVTLNFNPAAFHHPSRVRLFHAENGNWVDRTVSVNTVAGTITGTTMSLSPFAVFEPVNAHSTTVSITVQ
jgi:hypothetical protein